MLPCLFWVACGGAKSKRPLFFEGSEQTPSDSLCQTSIMSAAIAIRNKNRLHSTTGAFCGKLNGEARRVLPFL